MEAIVQIVSAHDPATELRTLRSALSFEEALRGRVEFRPASYANGAQSGEALVVALGADGAGAALTRSLAAWMEHREPRLRIRLTVDVESGELTQATAHELAAVLQPVPGSAVGDGTAAAPELSRDAERQRLIERIDTSVFPKPPRGVRGYDEDDVDAFLDAVVSSIRSGKPMKPAAIEAMSFRKPPFAKRGYEPTAVDALLGEIQQQLRQLTP